MREARVIGEHVCLAPAIRQQSNDEFHGQSGALHYRLAAQYVLIHYDSVHALLRGGVILELVVQ